jgi:outer membrane protein
MQEENIEKPQVKEETENIYHQPESVSEADDRKPPFFVFNSNTLLGLVLLAGLVALYVLYFIGSTGSEKNVPMQVQKALGRSLSVAYVNIDSLNVRYEYVNILRRDLESTGKKLQAELMAEQSALEKEGAEFQRQVSANTISEEKAKQVYEQLMQKSTLLDQKKQRYTQQVANQEMNMNVQLVDSVTSFLKRFNKQYRFDYILGYKTGGEILMANDTLDITQPVLDALNKEYRQRKK